MASGTAPVSPAQPSSGVPCSAEVVEYGRYIEGQLQRTRTQVKWVEISGGLMTLLAALLTYMIFVAVLDAWLVAGGLGTVGRWLCLLGLLAGGLGLFFWKVVPAVLKPINPVFAAHTIEQSRPTLKNGLINFLLLRARPDRMSPVVFQAVEQRAATELSQIEVDATVDRSRLIKLGYVLIGLMALAGVYKLVSPKDPFRSISRMVFPWAQIVPPSRVTIEELSPGDAEVFQGDYVEISLIARGVRDDEAVTLYYSTSDGQTVDRAVPLKRPDGGYRHVGSFPPGSDGLKQDVEYYVRAGDALSNRHQVIVKPAPAIIVKTVDLEYPGYTGLSRVTQDRGDIKALEGTIVTLRAKANQDIAAAHLDFDCDGSRDQAMQAVNDTATISFPLKLQEDGVTPQHSSYLIRFTNPRGHENPQPIRHTIEIVRDLPPEVSFQAPTEAEVELPRNGALAIGVKARDPDYALSRVTLKFELNDKPLAEQQLLSAPQSGEFRGQHVFDAAAHKLKAGDEVLYFAEVEDNKSPQPNSVRTLRQRIRIVEPVGARQREEQLKDAKENCRNMQDGDGRPGEGGEGAPRDDQQDADQPRDDQQAGGKKSDRPRDDGGADDAGDTEQGQPQDDASDEEKNNGRQNAGEKKKGGAGNRSQDKTGEGEKEQTESNDGSADDSQEKKSGDSSDEDNEGQKKKSGQEDGGQKPGKEGGEKQQGGKKDQRNSRVDPETESGDAIEEINKQREKQQAGKQPQTGDKQQQSGGKQQQPGGKQPPGQKPEKNQPPQPGGEQGDSGEQGASQDQQDPQGSSGKQSGDGSTEQGAGEDDAGGDSPQPGQGAKKPSERKQGQQPDEAGEPGEDDPQESGHDGSRQGKGSTEKGGEEGQSPEDAEESDGGKQPSPGGKKTDKQSSQPNSTPQDDPANEDDAAADKEGQGKEASGGANEKKTQPDEGENPQPGGNPQTEQGNSGAGQTTGKEKTAPPNQQAKPNRNKKQKGPVGASEQEKEQGDEPSESKDDRESDSQGDQSGDRAGGGKEGKGSKANKPGTGGDGQNTPSEEGSSQAEGKGTGRKSGEGGDQVEGTDPTGQSKSEKTGAGSKERAGGKQPGGANQPGGKQPPQGQPEQGGTPPEDADRANGGGGDPQGKSPKNASQPGPGEQGPAGPNQPDRDDPQRPQPPNAAAPDQASDPNLEYARQATDLALEYLKDQLDKDQPDQELLDKLGWSREDMEKFVRRWEEMKRRAKERGPEGDAARQRMQDELRGLGLRPQGTRLDRDSVQKEQERTRLRDSRRSEPPSEYAEQYKAYTQGKAKGRKPAKPAGK